MSLNYYQILGINQDASNEEIKKAYLKLVKRFHPDTVNELPSFFKDKCDEITKVLNEARDVLLTPEQREKYNQDLENGNDEHWYRFKGSDNDNSEMMESLIRKLQNTEKRLAEEKESYRRVLEESNQRLREEQENHRKIVTSFDKKRKITIGAICIVAAVLIVGGLAFIIGQNKESAAYITTIPLAESDAARMEGLYRVTITNQGESTTVTGEMVQDGENDFTLSVYGEGPISTFKCKITSPGVISSSLWGKGTISYTPSQDKITISFTVDNDTKCVLVK